MTSESLMRLHWLNPRKPQEPFPDPELALPEPNGLLAIGGDLSVTRLLSAYRQGIFPWFNPDEPILWWAPNPRTVFMLPDGLHVSRRMKRHLDAADFAVTLDRAFPAVIRRCAEPRRDQHGTWLGEQMIEAYTELYRRGHAHSVEVWRAGDLIGGVYGVAMGRAFFGESMFSRHSNASKIALVFLARQLSAWRFRLLDCQVGSAHLHRLGAKDMPRRQFQTLLLELTAEVRPSDNWRFEIPGVPQDAQHLPAGLPA